jgi:hypothetical protein
MAGGRIGVLAARRVGGVIEEWGDIGRRLFAAMVIVTALYVGWRALGT